MCECVCVCVCVCVSLCVCMYDLTVTRLMFQDYPLNPKAVSLAELYGEFDLATNEWADGVLSSVMRQTCAGRGHL